jgi:chromosome segregation ATPase
MDSEAVRNEETAMDRAEFDYHSGLVLNKEQLLRRKLETREFAMRRASSKATLLEKEVIKLLGQQEELDRERKAAEEAVERNKSTLQATQAANVQLNKELSKEAKRRKALERQVEELQICARRHAGVVSGCDERNRILQSKLEEQQMRLSQAELHTQEMTANTTRLELDGVVLRRQVGELRHEIQEANTRHSLIHDERVDLSSALESKAMQVVHLTRELEALGLQLDQTNELKAALRTGLTSTRASYSQQFKNSEQEMRDLRQKNSELLAEADGHKRAIYLLEEDQKTLRTHLAVTSKMLQEKERATADEGAEVFAPSTTHAMLRDGLTKATSRIAELNAEISTRDRSITELQTMVQRLDNSLSLLTRSRVDDLLSRDAIVTRARQTQAKVAELQHRAVLLLTQVRELEAERRRGRAESLAFKGALRHLTREYKRLRLVHGYEDRATQNKDGVASGGEAAIEELAARLCGDQYHPSSHDKVARMGSIS